MVGLLALSSRAPLRGSQLVTSIRAMHVRAAKSAPLAGFCCIPRARLTERNAADRRITVKAYTRVYVCAQLAPSLIGSAARRRASNALPGDGSRVNL